MLIRAASTATRVARTTPLRPASRALCSFPPGPLCRPNADTGAAPLPSVEQEAFEQPLKAPTKLPGEPEGLTPEAALNELVRKSKNCEGVFETEDVNPITGQWQNTALRGKLRALFRSKVGNPAPTKEV